MITTIDDNLATRSLIQFLEITVTDKEKYKVEFTPIETIPPSQDIKEIYRVYSTVVGDLLLEIYYSAYKHNYADMRAIISAKECIVNIADTHDQNRILRLLAKHRNQEPTVEQKTKEIIKYFNSFTGSKEIDMENV
jgi:hypothetical protein